ncbi:pilus assembly protein PilP [Pseudomonas sp. NPDC089401]|uniref:pilus assembly protein PilP n=1 Tax=Pseudomonas sp. NPDC089401 TaxID=3364462 RepID=UPI00380799B2
MKLVQRAVWQALIEPSGALRIALPVMAGFLLFVLGCLIRLPHWSQLQALEDDRRNALLQAHQAQAADGMTLVSASQALAQARQLLLDARWRLAAGAGMSDLLDQLAASGHAHGLHFERLDVLDEVKQPGFWLTPLDIEVVGRYAALRLWLDDWLGQVRLLRPEDLRLVPVDGKPGLLRLNLRVNGYRADGPVPEPKFLADVPARDEALPPALDPFSAWATRVTQTGLARVPLAQLEMVGSFQRGLEHEALLSSAGRLYRVRVGDRLGRDGGLVTQVGEQQLDVRERLFVGGVWRERTVMLMLRKSVEGEARDGDEAAVEVGGGGPDAGDRGDGGAVSG